MQDFTQLNLPQSMLDSITKLGIKTPTPIQAKTMPTILKGSDVVGTAQTGTGKTLAFGIPVALQLLLHPETTALILTPTRELAMQVMKSIQAIMCNTITNKTVLLIGGDPIHKQIKRLRTSNPRLIVGTPGRVIDHIERKTVDLSNTKFLVLDETDRMLDMGFSIQIDNIIKHIPKQRQTLLFSATMPSNIVKISKKYLIDPLRVAIDSTFKPAANLKQEHIKLQEKDKPTQLIAEIEKRTGSIIVFVKTKRAADRIAIKLDKSGHSAAAIHGDLRQSKRAKVIKEFSRGEHRVLVATDVAARGLDIDCIEHVINYDLPQCPEDYIHRIGRTARAGKSGEAMSFVTPGTNKMWQIINRLLKSK
jgi:ATP-dependent RNA helicase DeaD|tara:strand:- start:2905 stop:3993 length:1089 start_codon:yes stop_codon:yes gene_type:complete